MNSIWNKNIVCLIACIVRLDYHYGRKNYQESFELCVENENLFARLLDNQCYKLMPESFQEEALGKFIKIIAKESKFKKIKSNIMPRKVAVEKITKVLKKIQPLLKGF